MLRPAPEQLSCLLRDRKQEESANEALAPSPREARALKLRRRSRSYKEWLRRCTQKAHCLTRVAQIRRQQKTRQAHATATANTQAQTAADNPKTGERRQSTAAKLRTPSVVAKRRSKYQQPGRSDVEAKLVTQSRRTATPQLANSARRTNRQHSTNVVSVRPHAKKAGARQ